MIVQIFIFILSVVLICDVTGTSYSNVYVESKVAPMEYYSYGTPYPTITNPRLSQINSLPSVPGYIAPCVSPCVYPAQTVATVAPVNPVNPSQNVLTYNAPSVPIVVAPSKQEATGYEYSYVVYDDNTGDHKAQRELSDGSVVRGEYSFLQPDGYIRQVQYVADDISGFNAVVKQFLPAAGEGHRNVQGEENKESSPPCHELKNESLKEESEEDSGRISIKKLMKIQGNLHNKHSKEDSAEKSKGNHGTSKASVAEENSKEKHHKEIKKVSKEESGEESEEKSKEKHNDKSKKVSSKHSGEESKENFQEETLDKKSKESAGKSKEKHNKKAKTESKESQEVSEEETDSEDSKEELKDKSRKKSSTGTDQSKETSKKKSKKGSKEGAIEDSGEEPEEVSDGKHKEVHALLKPNQETLVPYNDILKCIEAAMRRNYGVPAAMRQEPSPLTYIVLNKPC